MGIFSKKSKVTKSVYVDVGRAYAQVEDGQMRSGGLNCKSEYLEDLYIRDEDDIDDIIRTITELKQRVLEAKELTR